MNKFSRGIALALFAFLPWPVWAEVNISSACRIKNRPPGRCGWCVLETLARHHRLKTLYGLSNQNAARCSPSDLETALDGTGVKYRIQYRGDRNPGILRYATEKALGAAVGFRELYPGAGGHIVTLIDFTDDGVKVIDPNDQDGRTRQMSRDRFLYWWDGFVLILEPGKTALNDGSRPEKREKAQEEKQEAGVAGQ